MCSRTFSAIFGFTRKGSCRDLGVVLHLIAFGWEAKEGGLVSSLTELEEEGCESCARVHGVIGCEERICVSSNSVESSSLSSGSYRQEVLHTDNKNGSCRRGVGHFPTHGFGSSEATWTIMTKNKGGMNVMKSRWYKVKQYLVKT